MLVTVPPAMLASTFGVSVAFDAEAPAPMPPATARPSVCAAAEASRTASSEIAPVLVTFPLPRDACAEARLPF